MRWSDYPCTDLLHFEAVSDMETFNASLLIFSTVKTTIFTQVKDILLNNGTIFLLEGYIALSSIKNVIAI